jgi:archaellum component FlaG (FlaF/FlaG flagellin family)
MSTTSPSSRRDERGASAILLLLLAVILFAAGAAAAWWYLTQRPATATTSAPTPAPDFSPLTPGTLASTPAPEATATPETTPPLVADAGAPPAGAPPAGKGRAAAPPRRPAKPPVAPAAPTAPQLLKQADAAAAAKRYAEAADLYDRALQIDPKNEAARTGLARIAAMGAGRTFVLGTTVVESLRSVGRDLQGFDTGGVGVKRAPKVEGRIELVMEPAKVEAGRPYSVMVFLKNDGKKPIEVDEMKVSMIVDGKWSTRPLPPKAKQVAPKQKVLLEELPGVWRAGVNDWAVEAVVTSKNQDVYRNRLTWK